MPKEDLDPIVNKSSGLFKAFHPKKKNKERKVTEYPKPIRTPEERKERKSSRKKERRLARERAHNLRKARANERKIKR